MLEKLEAFDHFFNPADLPSIGPETRSTRMPAIEIDEKLGPALSGLRLSPALQNLVRSLIYLWHDHFEQSHSLAQEISSADGSFVHGILHRREPDYGNARYWFNRVGNHPAFPVIAEKVTALQAAWNEEPLIVISHGRWDPFAFIAACEKARESSTPVSHVRRLEKIQEVEFRVLLNRFLTSR